MASKNSPANDRRTAIRAEMDDIRAKQSTGKASRGKLFDQLKAIQDGVQKRVRNISPGFEYILKFSVQTKDLQAARQKTPFKTVAEVDAQVK